jgi:chorismate-pyruvate lyase
MDSEFNLLFQLDRFYAQAGLSLPAVSRVPGEAVPQPYNQLLVGDHDMTPTLEAFHGNTVGLQVMQRELDHDTLTRMVVLARSDNGTPVEFGAILIYLSLFPPDARQRIVDGSAPLGTILATCHVNHCSRPQAFIRVVSDALIEEALGLTEQRVLYGRRNWLLTPNNEVLADIVEILPP